MLTNWAGNVTFRAGAVHRPTTVDELRTVVAGSRRLRPLGTAHSFSPIADTDGDLVSVAGLPPDLDLDAERGTVRVAAGLRYGEVAPRLHGAGYALANLGSLPHISIAGACATGTHGSGVGNGALATAVAELDLVTADGDLITLRRGDAGFAGAVVGLGALGVVTAVTLDVRPTYDVVQYVFEDLPRSADLPAVLASGYSVSFFTDWSGPRINQVWVKELATAPAPVVAGATPADGPRHPVPGMPTENCTAQEGEPGPWHTRLPHFRLDFTPSSGDELQSEFLLPLSSTVDALAALDPIAYRITPVLHVSEIRTVAADDLWLSPCYGRDSVAIHFTWHSDLAAVAPVLSMVEERLAPFGARPHWGKVFTTDPVPLYPRLADFAALAGRYDPTGKLRNPLLDRYLGSPG